MINDILAGIPWGILLSFMIGPVFFVLLETSVVKGFRAAVVFDFVYFVFFSFDFLDIRTYFFYIP